jgi:hypothetical protein
VARTRRHVRWKAQGHGRHVPRDVSDVVGAAAALFLIRDQFAAAQRLKLGRHADFRHLQLVLQRLCERLIGLGPLRQADLLDIRVHRFGNRLVEVPGPRGPKDPARHFRIGHHRRGLCHPVADIPQLLDFLVAGLAEVVPDRCSRRDDVRLVPAVGDDVMRALLDAQVLAAEVPPDVHQLRGVERRSAAPRRTGPVRALALEAVLDRDEAVLCAIAPADAKIVANVRENRDVDVLEQPGTHEVRLRADELFRNARPQHQRALEALLLHHPLHGERRGDLQRHPGVVPFTVARRARDHRFVIRHAGLLRRLRDVVDVRPEGDDWLPRSPPRSPRGRDSGDPVLNGEAVLLEDVGEVLRGLEFLEAELAEAEDRVVPFLDVFLHRVDLEADVALVLLQLRAGLP